MDERSKGCAEVVERILVGGAYKSTKYVYGENLTNKATRKRYKGRQNNNHFDIIITIGKPNYEEREALKKAKKEGIVLTFKTKYPVKK
jgi:hypothetical protein